MKSREQAQALINHQLSSEYDKYKSECFEHNEKYKYINNAWHYGKIELHELLDYIYEEKTGHGRPVKAQEGPQNTRYDAGKAPTG